MYMYARRDIWEKLVRPIAGTEVLSARYGYGWIRKSERNSTTVFPEIVPAGTINFRLRDDAGII